MRKLFLILIIFTFVYGCTKDVPENEKRISKSIEEEAIRATIKEFVTAYNNNDIEKAVSLFDKNYKGVAIDSDDFSGIEALRSELTLYRKEYPAGNWEISVDEINISGDYAYILSSGSFLMPDIIDKKMNPTYSEKSIRILKKNKDGNWKIFRFVAAPTFSYDKN